MPSWLALALVVALVGLCGCQQKKSRRTTRPTIDGTSITIDPSPLPDLVLANPVQMSTATSVSLSFTVADAGGGDASNVVWRVTRADGSQVAQGVIPTLLSGTTQGVTVEDGPQGVNQTFTIAVDPDGAIAESHEDNNTMEVTSVYVVTGQPLDGDLVINGAHPHGAIYYQDPEFHFFIENDSGQDLSGIQVSVRDEASGDVPGMPYTVKTAIPAHSVGPRTGGVGDEADGIFIAPFQSPNPVATPGRHVFHIVLDPNGAFAETNEANNDWRIVVDVPDGYGYWPLTPDMKTDVMFEDPHFHPADQQRYVTFHGWLHDFHPTKNLIGYDLIHATHAKYPGVAKNIVPFVLRREGTPVALAAPGFDLNRQRNYGVTEAGDAYFILPDGGIPVNGRLEYLFIVQEPNAVGEVRYSLDLDPDNVIDEQYEGTNAGQGAIDNNHAQWVIVMDPTGTTG
jgi:hypothetical protein